MADGDTGDSGAVAPGGAPPPATPFVVIGASAGGVTALQELVATLPADLPAPVVIAQHLDPARPSHLGEILAARAALPVQALTDHPRLPLEPGTLYVVPANRHVRVSDHELAVEADGAGHPKPSIDRLLSDAAAVFGEGTIAVILTGRGSDGAAGVRAVKEAGGTVVIQDPASASFPDMPLAVDPTMVDIVTQVGRIGPALAALLRGDVLPATAARDRALRAFLDELRERSGLDFGLYKLPTIRRRLQRRLVAVGAASLDAYHGYLRDHPEEYERLVNSFLIKVTAFFRDPELYAYLGDHVVPELIAQARARGTELRVWSAGCATGQEAYSLAILVAEALGDELDRVEVRIFATDLDAAAVAVARRGVYPPGDLAALPPALVARHFTRVEGGYAISKRLRALTVFGEHDLSQRAPFPRIDLCVCRNVLIYFTPELQEHALRLFAFALRDGGYLVLGKSETTRPLEASFAPVAPPLKVYRRQGERLPLAGTLVPPGSVRLGGRRPVAPPAPPGLPPRVVADAPAVQEGQVDDLLDVGRLEGGKLGVEATPLDLTPVIARVIETLQPEAEAQGQEIALEAPAAPLWVQGDAERLEQVAFNLLTNALKYAPGSPEIVVRLADEAGQAVLEVQDAGPGIPAEALPRLFERFYQVSRGAPSRQGLGLGLYLTRELVTAHGGTIEARSTEGAGATFIVRLPLLADTADHAEVVGEPAR